MKNDGQKSIANQIAVDIIQVTCAYTLEEALSPMPVASMRICEFPEATAHDKCETNRVRVDDGMEGKIEFLTGSQRDRLAIHHYIEQGQDTDSTLLFLRFHFALCFRALFPRLSLRVCFVFRG